MRQQPRACLLLLAAALLSIAALAQAQSIARLNVCPNALYLKVPFLGAAVDASYFSGITTWKTDQISSYLRDKVLPRVATNLAFLGIALIALIVFLLWRLFRCCCNMCCKKDDDPEAGYLEPALLVSGPMVTVIKLLVVVAAVGGVALGAVGIATANKVSPEPVFGAVNLVIDYGKLVAGRMSGVLASVQGLNPISYQIVQASNSPTLNSSQASALRSASSMLNSSVLSVVGGPTVNVQDLNNSINKAFDSSKTTDDMFNQYSKIIIQALQGVYAGTLVLMLLLALFVIIHCPFGIAFFVAVCFLVAVLLYLLGAILALALIAATDVCTNMEPIISIVAPSKYLPVLSYYLYYTEPATSLEDALSASSLVNVTDIRAQATSAVSSASSALTAVAASASASDAATLNSITGSINATYVSINAAIGTSSGANASGLLGAAGYRAVNDVYVGFKVATCCTMVDQVLGHWAALTALGWLVMLTCLFAISMLRRLDQLPQGGTCCACRMLTPGKVQAAQDEAAAAKPQDNGAQQTQAPQPMAPMYYPPTAPPQPYAPQQPQPYYYAQPVGAAPPADAGMYQARSLPADSAAATAGADAGGRGATHPPELPPRRAEPDMSIPNVTVPAIAVPTIAGLDTPAWNVVPPAAAAAGEGVPQPVPQTAGWTSESYGPATQRDRHPGAATPPPGPSGGAHAGGDSLF